MTCDLLVVDDETDIRELISGILADEGYEARTAADSDSALAAIADRLPRLVILDIWLQGSRLDGLEILEILKRQHPELPVIMISGHGNIETAVAAIKRGAFDFIEKPFKTDHLLHLVARATEHANLKRENAELRRRSPIAGDLIGTSPPMNALRQTIGKVGPTNSRVLISGPPGSGKEVTARQLHRCSARKRNAFIVVNAASMKPDSMEVELFGCEASPGAAPGERRIGVFERAHGGTLFLDEIAEMPARTQSKILRVLVDQTFERVGGDTQVRVDVRVISATSRDLRSEIGAGRFREDLYHRLNVVPIVIPSLAERRPDIPVLAGYFMERLSKATGKPARVISDDALAALQAYDWPGNVRQLRNVIERLLILAGDNILESIRADLFPSELISESGGQFVTSEGDSLTSVPLREAREIFEREYLRTQISRFGGNISRTADFVGMERSALHRKLKSLGLHNGSREPGESAPIVSPAMKAGGRA